MSLKASNKDLISQHLQPLLNKREWPKTICPSEVARALSTPELAQLGAESWRDAMPDIRDVVWEMRENGEVEVLQKGEVIEGSIAEIHGPIRVRKEERVRVWILRNEDDAS
jgi:hypothetical protein